VDGKLDEAGLTRAERVLLDYVELITKAAHRSTAADVESNELQVGRKNRFQRPYTLRRCLPSSIALLMLSVSRRRITL
jgi:hypothetical protein